MSARVPRVSGPIRTKVFNNKEIQIRLLKAQKFELEENYPRAYESYVNYFESLENSALAPPAAQEGFTKVVCIIGDILEQTDNLEELLKCYIKAINLLPDNYHILNQFGSALYRIGEWDIAKRYWVSATSLKKDFLSAEKNLLHIMWHEVPRWHFKMLNDKKRNLAYNKAIKAALAEDFLSVIDIGAGCGLLSLMAATPKAIVVAVERNKILSKMCERIAKNNNLVNVFSINSHSNDLATKNSNNKYKNCFNLLVTEIFDVVLFGEYVLETLHHAHKYLLSANGDFKIIPQEGHLYVTAIKCQEIARKSRYIHSLPEIKLVNTSISVRDPEPYDAEYLQEKHVIYVTDTQEIEHVFFENSKQIADLFHGNLNKIIELTANTDSAIDALAVWFNLDLGYNVQITTDPRSSDCAASWEQGIFYLDEPIHLKKGQKLKVRATLVNSQLKLVLPKKRPEDTISCSASQELLAFINDKKLVETIVKLSKRFNDPNWIIFDSHVFPLFGILLAKKGFKVVHIYKDDKDWPFISHILKINNILKSLTYIKDSEISTIRPLAENAIAFHSPVSSDGSLNKMLFMQCCPTKDIIPNNLNLYLVLVNSDYIDHCNKVNDENTLNFKIADEMNKYTGCEHPDLEVFPHIKLSDPKLVVLNYETKNIAIDVPATQAGMVNALYYWFDIHYLPGTSFSTLESTYYKKCCFILDKPREVSVGDVAKIKIMVDYSCYMKFIYE